MRQYPGSLHNHTEYSNLDVRDSINRIDDMMNYAIELGHSVLAFTEHETICNSIKIEKAYKKIKADHPDFKVIRGNEIYLCRNGLDSTNFVKGQDNFYHFILLAKDEIGHKQIRELSTRAWMRSWRIGKMTRRPTYYQDLIDIIKSNPGHVIGSTACLGGFFAKKILQWDSLNYDNNFKQKIIGWTNQMIGIFGKDDFYFEMQPSEQPEQIIVNKTILSLSKELGIKYIITTDSHYLKKEDRPIHSAFLKSQEAERETDAFYATTYMMGTDEIESYINYLTPEELEEAYNTINEIKDKCVDYSLMKPLTIPSLIWRDPAPIEKERMDYYKSQIPMFENFLNSDFEGDSRMIKLLVNKLESDPRLQNKEHYDMINSNLNTTWISSNVNHTHWSAYFLNLQKNIEVCWNSGSLVGPGRGSGVGFLLLYLLDITQINPLWETTKCFEWRFLNPDRVSVLDIDTDIEGGRRANVLEALRDFYGHDRVSNVLTFGTEKSKSAIQTAARGLGIDNDEALYISSLIPADRGQTRTLRQCYYGDEDNDFEPIPLFIKEMDEHKELWEVSQRIEGLVCRVGEHAGGVIFEDKPFTESTALMKVPNGDVVTQFDLHDCEDVSLIKIDLLSIEALDKIHAELDLLCEYGKIERKATLKETYESVIGIYNLERDNKEMWKMVWNHDIQSLFQMEKQSGVQGIATLKPTSVDDLAVLNSTIRLMAQEGATERPTDKLARFKRDKNAWDNELKEWGLGAKEKAILEPVLASSYGLCIAQEQFMQLVQLPELGGFSLTWADKLRKSIAKKNPKEFDKLTDEFYKVADEKKIDSKFAHYVWEVLISMSKGYGFNQSHTLAYSLVALQEMNLAYHFPIIYWNTACLITSTGGVEDIEGDKGNDYTKLAEGVNRLRSEGVSITLPTINKSTYTFLPDEENNTIIFGLRGIMGVGEEIIKNTIENRPYTGWQDYVNKISPNKAVMVMLIKSGAFDEFGERSQIMDDYLKSVANIKEKVNLQTMSSLIEYNLIPAENKKEKSVFEFNRYLKSQCKFDKEKYKLNERAINFLNKINADDLIETDGDSFYLSVKSWDKKVYQPEMNIMRTWIASNSNKILKQLNNFALQEEKEKYAEGNYSSWEMEALSFYYHDHELAHIDNDLYGISDFNKLSEEPVVEKTATYRDKEIKYFKLNKIAGTCIAKNKNKSTVKLLTTTGVVEVRFNKDVFAIFDKQIKAKDAKGDTIATESSWFNKGSKILVQGIRSGDQFIPKKYKNSPGHHLMKIVDISGNHITLTSERLQGEENE